ncbi:MAG TPA: sulfotransferase domain-containing protein, partial [Myxococcota bacterium]|nr:sulfotransferase domain-containing protein [Myxococcota bacterium]
MDAELPVVFQAGVQARLETLRAVVEPRVRPVRARWASLRPDGATLPSRLKALRDRDAPVFSPEAQAIATRALCSFAFHPTDVFISTAARSGTTLTQQIVHQLRTGGDMSYTSIDEVVPWLDLHLLLNVPLSADRLARHRPRAYKTHLRIDQLPLVRSTV